jgi:hypothetical protein
MSTVIQRIEMLENNVDENIIPHCYLKKILQNWEAIKNKGHTCW